MEINKVVFQSVSYKVFQNCYALRFRNIGLSISLLFFKKWFIKYLTVNSCFPLVKKKWLDIWVFGDYLFEESRIPIVWINDNILDISFSKVIDIESINLILGIMKIRSKWVKVQITFISYKKYLKYLHKTWVDFYRLQ